MLGWQLLSLAGVVPSANAFNHQDGIEPFWMQVRETTNLSISRSVKATLPQILAYQWGEDTPLEFPKTIWKELERLLFAYCEQEIGKPLQSVKFLNSII